MITMMRWNGMNVDGMKVGDGVCGLRSSPNAQRRDDRIR